MQARARRQITPGGDPLRSWLRGRGLRGSVDAIIDSNTVSSRSSTEDVALGDVAKHNGHGQQYGGTAANGDAASARNSSQNCSGTVAV
jgi:hypothetical protein